MVWIMFSYHLFPFLVLFCFFVSVSLLWVDESMARTEATRNTRSCSVETFQCYKSFALSPKLIGTPKL